MADPTLTRELVEPAKELAETLSDHGLYGVIAVLLIFVFIQIIHFFLARKDCQKCRREIDETQDNRNKRYDTLLDERHKSYVLVLRDSLTSMHKMSESSTKLQRDVEQLEKLCTTHYNTVKKVLDELRRSGSKNEET